MGIYGMWKFSQVIYKLLKCISLFFGAVYLNFSVCLARELVNQSFFSIEEKQYSALQIDLLLNLWNALAKSSGGTISIVPRTTNLLGNKDVFDRLGIEVPKSGLERVQKLPKDLQRALFICLVWVEAKRLNLFETAPSEIDGIHERFMKDEHISKMIKRLGTHVSQESIHMVLRAGTYLKVRGDFDKNLTLANLSWSFL